MVIPRVVVAAPASGSGKTTVATGLVAALAARGSRPAAFKVGPDFIDPSYHRLASGRPGRNLDPFLCGEELIGPLFRHGARDADIAVIEGVMGLFDGRGSEDFSSTAHVARLLGAPVILVVDARSMSASVAALVSGFAGFDPRIHVAGVVLNRVGSERHERLLREALERIGVPVVGAIGRDPSLATPERHLGLVPAAERETLARRTVAELGERIGATCDLDAIARLAASAGPLGGPVWTAGDALAAAGELDEGGEPVRVAVAAGPAFSFRYEENLELLSAAGAELAEFDPLADERLPEGTGAIYLGGGFPETYATELNANDPLRAALAAAARARLPIVAECGGMLFLCRELDGRPMCGVLDAEARMGERLSLGYREARAAADSVLAPAGLRLRAHEFHYTRIEPEVGETPAWSIEARGGGRQEGFVAGSVHASYLHTHWAGVPELPSRFVASARRVAAPLSAEGVAA